MIFATVFPPSLISSRLSASVCASVTILDVISRTESSTYRRFNATLSAGKAHAEGLVQDGLFKACNRQFEDMGAGAVARGDKNLIVLHIDGEFVLRTGKG